MKTRTRLLFFALTLFDALPLSAQNPAPAATLFQNVRIFNGKSGELSAPSYVLVRGNLIEKISTTPIPTDKRANTVLIDDGGRTLMPGLIDAHVHMTFWTLPIVLMQTADPNYLQVRMGATASGMLMDGFTSVQDLDGPVFGLKRAIDEGFVVGPRIWPSGTMVSQTSGHSDHRMLNELPSAAAGLSAPLRFGYDAYADGPAGVHRLVREQLMQGASQIKLAVGGGVSSNYDPIDVTEFTKEEIEAAVADAENWGTYVNVHGYTPRAIRLAVDAGVKCIDHGQLVDEPTIIQFNPKGHRCQAKRTSIRAKARDRLFFCFCL